MELLFNRFPQGRQKALTMSYDDGRAQDERLIALFNRHGIVGTFHLNAGWFGKPGYIPRDRVQTLYAGHELSAHAYTHQSLPNVPREKLIDEIWRDRLTLEAIAGAPVTGMSYPYGDESDEVVALLRGLGMQYARRVQTTKKFGLPQDFLRWEGTCHHNEGLLALGEAFLALQPRFSPALMYVWGHSYEFDGDDNWAMIEAFCQSLGGRDDIWYATNAQIVAYWQAVRGVQFSADTRMARNPSALDVWISVDGAPLCLPGGQVTRW